MGYRLCRLILHGRWISIALLAIMLVGLLPQAAQAISLPTIPPIANNDAYTTASDAPITPLVVAAPGVLANDSGSALTAVLVTPPTHATAFTLNANGGFSYTPMANYLGPDSFVYKANNGHADSVAATVSIAVGHATAAPTITSANATTFTIGAAGSFTVTTTGFPLPTLAETGALPGGVTFTDNHDGTATLAGTPSVSAGGVFVLAITAHNGVGADATQTFTLTVNGDVTITSADHTTFTVGQAPTTTFTITTAASPTVTMISETGGLPGGVTFTDNHDGTAKLVGAPNAGTGGAYSIVITAHNGAGPDVTQTFTLTVNQAPAITSANSTTFVETKAGTFTVVATGFPVPTFSEVGPLPTGVTLTSTGTLSGTPAAGTGGVYPIVITVHNGVGADATQNFTLTVDVAPTVTSTTPTNTATNVALNATVTITFSQSVATTGTTFKLECPAGTPVAFTVTPASPAASYVLHPTANLPAGAICTVTVVANQVTDGAGAHMAADYLFTFTVDTPPTVTTTTPANNATTVALNATVTINFSQSVTVTGTAFTLECPSGTPVAFTVTPASPASSFVLHPTSILPGGVVCTVTVVANQVTDGAGTQMTANYVFTFTVDVPPTVTSTTPANGATGVAPSVTVTVNFSTSVNVTASAFKLECPSGTLVALTVTPGSPATSFILHPTSSLPAGVVCTVTVVASQVTDTAPAATPMAANYLFTFTVDTAPTVTTTTPANNATGVAPSATVTINFSESVNVTATAFKLECPSGTPVPFTVTPASPASSFVLHPTSILPAPVICTVTVVAAQVNDVDAGQHPTADFVFTFTTDQQPSVSSIVPANGATSVALNATVTVTFSEQVNITGTAFTLECPAGTPVAFTVTPASPASSFVLHPTGNLPASTNCTVTVVASQVTDTDVGQHMTADFTSTFTVDTPPTVTSTTPTNAATGVAPSVTVTINFSEPVNVTGTAFTLECPAATPVAFTVTPASPAASFVLHPTANLPGGVTCTATVVANQVTDVDAGSALVANFVFSFTVDTPPAVTSTTPANGTTNVAPAATVTVNFSESVNVTASAFTLECPSGTPVAFTVTPASPATSFVLHPTANLPGGVVCTVTVVANQVSDVDVGQNMAANFISSFTIDLPPTVSTTTPANNATGVVPSATVTVNFSESVNVTGSAFTLECPAGTPVAFTVTPASPAASFVLHPTTALPAGIICTATVVASQVSDVDVGQNMTANYVFTFSVPPVATSDTYPHSVIGNVSVNSALISYSVTTNDIFAAPVTITAYDAVSAHGGTVTLTTSGVGMGQLTYNPAAGYTGPDSFTYTITNAAGSGTGTVSLTVSGIIWFINNNASAGDGRLSSPFNSLAAFQAINDGIGNHPAANANIFLSDSATAYSGPVTLLNGQKLIGQDATATLSTITGLTPGASSATLPTTGGGTPNKVSITSAGNTVTLGSGNTVWGVTLGNAPGTALTGASVGSLKLRDLTVNTTGAAISLTSGALDAILTQVSSGGGTHGIALTSTTGSLEITGDGASDTANTTRGRTTAKNGGGTLAFGSGGTIAGATSAGVLLSNAAGVTLRNMTIQNNGSGINTGGDGITALGGTSGLTLDNVLISGHAGNYGLHGTTVSNVTLQHTEISANATTAGVETPHVWNIRFDDLTGTSSMLNSLFFNSRENIVGLQQGNINPTATLSLTVTNSEFRDTATTSPGNDGLSISAFGSANVSLNVSNSTFVRNRSNAIQYTGNNSSGGGTFAVTNNTFDQNAIDVNIAHQGLGKTVSFDINGNTMRQAVGGLGNSINIFLGGLSNTTTLLQGKVRNNTIGNNAVPNSGSSQGQGINLFASGGGKLTALVDSNIVRQILQDSAFQAISSSHTGQLNVTITNNDFSVIASAPLSIYGIDITAGGSGTDTSTTCVHLANNIAAIGNSTLWGIDAQSLSPGATLLLEGYLGAQNDTAQIAAFLNTRATTVSPAVTSADVTVVGTIKAAPSPCPTPP